MHPTLTKFLGWKETSLQSDPLLYDEWRWLRKHLRPGPLRTLDVNCGTGGFSLFAAALGNEVFGIDPDAANIRNAESSARSQRIRGAQFFRSDAATLLELSKKKGFERFDTILCLHATSYLEANSQWISRLTDLLKPEGRLLLTAEYRDHHREKPKEEQRGFTPEALALSFQQAGLQILEQEYLSGLISQTVYNATRIFHQENSKVALGLVLPLRLLHAVDSPVTRLIGHPHQQLAIAGVKVKSLPVSH